MNIIGTVSEKEARDALRKHKGSVWDAVTECVDQRQRKVISPEFLKQNLKGTQDVSYEHSSFDTDLVPVMLKSLETHSF